MGYKIRKFKVSFGSDIGSKTNSQYKYLSPITKLRCAIDPIERNSFIQREKKKEKKEKKGQTKKEWLFFFFSVLTKVNQNEMENV